MAVSVGLGTGLAGCANGAALGLVQQACHHVHVSLALYRSSQTAIDRQKAAQEQVDAEVQLQKAQPLATEAAGEAPQWQALMATLEETARLPESDMVQALESQCSIVQTGGTTLPTLPVTTLPAPPGKN